MMLHVFGSILYRLMGSFLRLQEGDGLPKPDWIDHSLRFQVHASWAGVIWGGWLAKTAM